MTAHDERGAARQRSGPLLGVKVVEIAAIGPAPFAGMLLSDLGADVIRVDRLSGSDLGLPLQTRFDCTSRGRRSVATDLKTPEGVRLVRELSQRADVLIEGFRPGVMERLGLGPEDLLESNPRLVYGRVTGWGQTGPLSRSAGHDLNYVALTGALHAIGRAGQPPTVPLNLVGDYGGGALYLAFGVACALLHAWRTGRGQVVDAAMCDGAASMMTLFYGMLGAGRWQDRPGSNALDGGAPWYDSYETADGRYVAIGAIEPKFFNELLTRLGLDPERWPAPQDRSCWDDLRTEFVRIFRTRTRDEWCAALEGSDACFAPVLSLAEAPQHPHNVARATFVEIDGVVQPGPAPRFSATPGRAGAGAPRVGQGGREALSDWGFTADQVEKMSGVLWEN